MLRRESPEEFLAVYLTEILPHSLDNSYKTCLGLNQRFSKLSLNLLLERKKFMKLDIS